MKKVAKVCLKSAILRNSKLIGGSVGVALIIQGSVVRAYADSLVPMKSTHVVVHAPEQVVVANPKTIKEKFTEFTEDAMRILRYLARLMQYCLYGAPLLVIVPATMIGVSTNSEEAMWNYLIWAIEQLGPTFIKLAQWASSRPDLYPPLLIDRLKRLQDDVTVRHSMSTVEGTLRDAFGDDWKTYIELDPKPIGAGCIAQVFKGKFTPKKKEALEALARAAEKVKEKEQTVFSKARGLLGSRRGNLKGSGSADASQQPETFPVAVKLIHPHVEELIKIDMELLGLAANFMDRFPTLELLSLGDTCRQFAEMMKDQLDLRKEAYNLRKFTAKFAHENWVVFPAPVEGYVQKHVLVETYMEGTPLNTYMAPAGPGEIGVAWRKLQLKLADLALRAMLKMIFFDNFVHGDLHPGNVMVQFAPNGDPRFVFLDCGLVFRAKTEEEHQTLIDICLAFMKHDGLKAGRLMVKNSLKCHDQQDAGGLDPSKAQSAASAAASANAAGRAQGGGDTEAFCQGLQTMINDTEQVKFFDHFGAYVSRICDLARDYRVKLDPDYFHVAMVLKVAEGMALSLNKELDLITTCIPIVLKAQALQKLGITKFPVPGEDDDADQ